MWHSGWSGLAWRDSRSMTARLKLMTLLLRTGNSDYDAARPATRPPRARAESATLSPICSNVTCSDPSYRSSLVPDSGGGGHAQVNGGGNQHRVVRGGRRDVRLPASVPAGLLALPRAAAVLGDRAGGGRRADRCRPGPDSRLVHRVLPGGGHPGAGGVAASPRGERVLPVRAQPDLRWLPDLLAGPGAALRLGRARGVRADRLVRRRGRRALVRGA